MQSSLFDHIESTIEEAAATISDTAQWRMADSAISDLRRARESVNQLSGVLSVDLIGKSIVERATPILQELSQQSPETRIQTINALRKIIHELSPFKDEPVDCVEWVPAEEV